MIGGGECTVCRSVDDSTAQSTEYGARTVMNVFASYSRASNGRHLLFTPSGYRSSCCIVLGDSSLAIFTASNFCKLLSRGSFSTTNIQFRGASNDYEPERSIDRLRLYGARSLRYRLGRGRDGRGTKSALDEENEQQRSPAHSRRHLTPHTSRLSRPSRTRLRVPFTHHTPSSLLGYLAYI